MIVHFRDYGVEPEFDDLDAFMHDDGRPGVGQAARAAPTRRALSPRILRAINPMLVKGQIAGSMVQGLGGALFEEFVYDADGQPLAVTFADYLLPDLSVVPDLEILLTEDAPSPLNPLGIKGGGESAITAVGAVIAAAIDDALGRPGAVKQLPVTPQRLHALLKQQ